MTVKYLEERGGEWEVGLISTTWSDVENGCTLGFDFKAIVHRLTPDLSLEMNKHVLFQASLPCWVLIYRKWAIGWQSTDSKLRVCRLLPDTELTESRSTVSRRYGYRTSVLIAYKMLRRASVMSRRYVGGESVRYRQCFGGVSALQSQWCVAGASAVRRRWCVVGRRWFFI